MNAVTSENPTGGSEASSKADAGPTEIAKRINRTIPEQIKNDLADGAPPPIPPEAQQKIAELEQQVQELGEKADANSANVTREEIRKESAIEVAKITGEYKADLEELKGFVKLLVAQIPPPAPLASEVGEDLAEEPPEAEVSPR